MKFFPGQGKVREFCRWLRTLKVKEKSGNLKINGYGTQSLENIFVKQKGVLSHEIVFARLPPHWGLLLKKKICSLGEQSLSLNSNPRI